MGAWILILATCAVTELRGSTAPAAPPPGAFSFKRFGADQGLDSQHIVRLTQDRDGFIWVATVAGLYRFDGRRFELFGAESGLDPGVVTDVVPAGTLGSVWVTQPRRISLLRNGKATDVTQLGLPLDTSTVYQYVNVVANEGADAFATVRGVPYEFRDGRFRLIQDSPVQRVAERNTYVGRLFGEGRDRELYLAHGNLRVLYRNRQGVWSRQDLPDFEGRPIAALLKDRRGRIWMRTDRALWRLDTFGAKPIQEVSGLSAAGGERPTLAEDLLGRIWTPTERGLLCVAERGHWLLGEAEGLPKGGAFTVLVDRDGSLWAGGPELLRVKGRMSCTSFTTANGLPVDEIQAVLRTRDGKIWVGTSKGVSLLEGNRFVLVAETSGIGIGALAEDASGAVWAAGSRAAVTDRNVIALKPPKSSTFQIIPIAIGPRESPAVAMAWDPSGKGMWIATGANGVNLIRRLPGGGFGAERARAFGQGLTFTTVLYVDPRRRLWSVTGELGMVYLEKGEWHRVPNPPDVALSTVSAVVMDGRGELWAAAWDGKFVVRLREEGGTWRLAERVSHAAVTGDIVAGLALDSSGALWMATSRGLKRWDGRRCERIASSEGLPGDDSVNNTLLVEPAGPVWVGTTLGLGRHDPAAAAAPVSPPPTRILAVTDGMNQRLVDLPGLTIPHHRGTLAFAFATPQYLNEAKIVQEARLVGLENNWHVTPGGQVRYARLPPGQYRFEARSTDAEGRTGPPVTFAFRIERAWYQTWWSYAIAIAALCAGAAGVLRWRVSALKARERELIQRVDERTRDLQQELLDHRRTEERLQEQMLVRQHAEEALRTLNDELEARVQARAAELAAAFDALASEKERLAVTLRSIGDGVIATDTDGRVLLMSRAAEELTGWTQEEAQGRLLVAVLRVVDPHTREPLPDFVSAVAKGGGTMTLPTPMLLLTRDGREITIADSVAPIRDPESRIRGVVVAFRDMTEHLRAEEQMQNAQKLEALGILAGGIAHDFNNLLTGIFGYIELARHRTGDKERVDRALDRASEVINRARGLTGQLLTFTRAGTPVTRPIALGEVLQSAARFALSGSNVRCEIEVPPDLWTCQADERQIDQVVDNLLLNSRQAMLPDGGTITISARNLHVTGDLGLPLAAGRYLQVVIRDTGTGIPREHQARVFDPFFTTKPAGSGLGLATAYSVVRKHGGHIELQSTVGEGTAFTLYLPAADGAPRPAEERAQEEPQGEGRVLVMDDEEHVREIARGMLEDLGYAAETACDGEEAVALFGAAKAKGQPFDIVILDLTVPGGTGGVATLARLRQLDAGVRAIASSGHSSAPIMSHPRGSGFVATLPKPYTRQELAAILRRFLSGRPG